MRSRPLFAASVLALALSSPAVAADIGFGDDLRSAGWRDLIFRNYAATQYQAKDGVLSIRAEQSSSMLYRQLAGKELRPHRARWSWRVDEGVGPTDLTKKGGDDSPVALYFIFADEKTAERLAVKAPSMLRMLGTRKATTLVYVFGGAETGPLKSPYLGGRSQSIVLRTAMSARGEWFSEDANLAADHARAFGAPPERLIAIAVSSDSDDTGGRNVVFVRDLAVD